MISLSRAIVIRSMLPALSVFCCSITTHAKAQNFSGQSDAAIEQYIACSDKTDGFDWNDLGCTQKELSQQAEILDEVYGTVLSRLDAKQKKLLMRSQHIWREKMNRTCRLDEFLKDKYPGTLKIIETKSCLATEMSGRIRWLERKYGGPQQ